MESKKQQSRSSTLQRKVWASMVTTTLGVVLSFSSVIIAAAETLKVGEWGLVIAAMFAAVALSAVFTSVLSRREGGSSRITKIKEDLSSAYSSALDRSSLNPLRGGSK